MTGDDDHADSKYLLSNKNDSRRFALTLHGGSPTAEKAILL